MFADQLQAIQDGNLKDGLQMFERLCNTQGLSSQAQAYALAHRGEAYRLQKHYPEALADFGRAIELESYYAWAIGHRGETYRLMKRYEEALSDFDRAIELDPEDAWTIAERGQTYQLMKCYEEALADFHRAIELEPYDAWPILHRGQTYRHMGRYEEALQDFDRAIELDPDFEHEGQKEIGLVLRSLGKRQEAADAFLRALAVQPACDECWILLAKTYGISHSRAEIPRLLQEISVPDANTASVIACRAEAMGRTGHYEEALADFNRAIDLDPDDAWAIASRGQVYQALECYGEALADFNRAIQLKPDLAWVILSRGRAYRQIERYEEALHDFERAIELDRDLEHVGQKEIGLVLWALGKHQEATDAFRRALAAQPACDECWALLTRIHEALHCGYEEVLADIDRAIALDDKDVLATLHRGQIYLRMKRYEEALADFDRAIALDESIINGLSNQRGLVLSYLGRYSEAIESYEQGLKGDPVNYAILYNIAVATARWRGLPNAQTQIDTARDSLLAVVDTDESGAVLYGLGGLAALEGNTDQALNYLQEAISLEQQAINWARHDVAWLDLRGDPRFRSLTSETARG